MYFDFLYKFCLNHSSFQEEFSEIRYKRWAGHVARMGEDRGVHRVLVGRPKGKKQLGRPRRRWEDNIKTDLQDIGGVVWTGWCWLRIGTGGGHLWVR
jgi:hypothetical protein